MREDPVNHGGVVDSGDQLHAAGTAAELTVSIADTVDGKVASLPDDLVARNVAAGSRLKLLHAEHRAELLNEIDHLFR